MKYNIIYTFFSYLIFFSCSAQKLKKEKINTKISKEYLASRKSFVGKLNSEEYKEVRKAILTELTFNVDENKAILINYYQYGSNCSEYRTKEKHVLSIIENYITISSKISIEYNANYFFVYSSNALNKEILRNNSNFQLDSGFFEKNIFTLKENCRAFFILKPNGEFMKHYGSDYFSEVKNFLEKE